MKVCQSSRLTSRRVRLSGRGEVGGRAARPDGDGVGQLLGAREAARRRARVEVGRRGPPS